VPGSLYAWTPDAKAAPEGKTWVTAVDPENGHIHGDPKLVETSQIQPMRSFDPESRRKRTRKKAKTDAAFQTKKRTPRPPTPRKRPGSKGQQALAERRRELQATIKQAEKALKSTKDPDKIAALESAIVAATEALKTLGVSTKASVNATTVKWDASTAQPGTYLHRLENGYYPVIEFAKGDSHLGLGRRTHGVFVPPQDVPAVFSEFEANMVSAANKVADKYRIRDRTGREDVVSGAKLGLMLALRSYTGGSSFLRHAKWYMHAYALDAARDVKSAGSAKIPMRQMQMIHGLIAASNRAAAINGVAEPTAEQIAREWNLKKEQTFSGRKPAALGVYASKDGNVYDQASQQVPLNEWQLLSPTGEPVGNKYPGKLALIAEMQSLLAGNRVADSQWINDHQNTSIPLRADTTMPLGAQHHLRQQIDEVTAKLSPRNKATIELLFGLDEDGESDSRSGYVITKEDLAARLGLAKKTASKATIYNKANKAIADALAAFKKEAVAQGKGRMATAASTKWNRIDDNPPPKKTGPTFRDLRERFGGADRARMYLTAMRAGEGSKAAKTLEDWKAGKLTVGDIDKFLGEHTRRRDVERMRQFHNQQSTMTVDPAMVKPPRYETSQEADYLYADEVALGAMRAIANGVKRPAKPDTPVGAAPWDDARFKEVQRRLERLKELRRQ
jgi:DNA-directed RNA polymerase sigma subunit (sigma70/sigma32)